MNSKYGYDPWNFSHKYFHIRRDSFIAQPTCSDSCLVQILELKIKNSEIFSADYEKVTMCVYFICSKVETD